ncbi:alpha-crystallin A chain-like [Ptychodera flava]|uniref:alpha-crystallin A chain-like n=1 Tax=Ptychodera flava TaxID=63121 RepID=UPI00396A522A
MLPVRMLPTFRLARQMAREMQEIMAEMHLSPFSRYHPFSRGLMEMTPQQMLNEHLGYMDRVFSTSRPSIVSSAHYRYSKAAPERNDVKEGLEGKGEENTTENESKVAVDEGNNTFRASVNLSSFKPENIEVTLQGNRLQIRAKQEEKAEDGYEAYREYTQRYLLPDNVDLEKLTTELSKDGLLTFEAPVEAKPTARKIPIMREDIPAVENNESPNEKEHDERKET